MKTYTNLMKQRFGINKTANLVFKVDDSLHRKFRKLADYVYKNRDWQQEDEISAVQVLIESIYGNNSESKNYAIQRLEKSLIPVQIAKNLSFPLNHAYSFQVQFQDEYFRRYAFLDGTNKSGDKHGEVYYPRMNTNLRFIIGNVNRTLGYSKLYQDIMKEFNTKEFEFTRNELNEYLKDLMNGSKGSKKYHYLFRYSPFVQLTDEQIESFDRVEDARYWIDPMKDSCSSYRPLTEYPESNYQLDLTRAPIKVKTDEREYIIEPDKLSRFRRKDKILSFIEAYIEENYDIILQANYEKNIEKQVRAKAWQTKEHINQQTQSIMDTTRLNQYFRFVEIDNEVDLSLFPLFEEELSELQHVLPKSETTDVQPILRLRKLGNYKALGLFAPENQTIAIDFRDNHAVHEDSYSPNGVGIQSFIHEYAHFLDYFYADTQLSMQEDFRSIVHQYRKNLNDELQYLDKNDYLVKKATYYTTPTEVFARAFEIYVFQNGLETNLNHGASVYQHQAEYLLYDAESLNQIEQYFNQQFPQLKENIQRYMQNKIHLHEQMQSEREEDSYG
ncbi:LPD1 domain-containing protein [uncultured Enterococcus sp.]|uniref:LPD1 domain-containing protein n=1 Tax=uncultured Enterococcus sp. TaxID=167972 RepID=UPI002629F101|nr:LPD1 domain-containing protein [uncultured Enterococcus sp.]